MHILFQNYNTTKLAAKLKSTLEINLSKLHNFMKTFYSYPFAVDMPNFHCYTRLKHDDNNSRTGGMNQVFGCLSRGALPGKARSSYPGSFFMRHKNC